MPLSVLPFSSNYANYPLLATDCRLTIGRCRRTGHWYAQVCLLTDASHVIWATFPLIKAWCCSVVADSIRSHKDKGSNLVSFTLFGAKPVAALPIAHNPIPSVRSHLNTSPHLALALILTSHHQLPLLHSRSPTVTLWSEVRVRVRVRVRVTVRVRVRVRGGVRLRSRSSSVPRPSLSPEPVSSLNLCCR